MSTNMTLIETKTAGVGGVASFDFTGLGSYSSTYTDLYLVCSIRATQYTADNLFIQLNNSSSNFTFRNIYHTGSGTPSVTSGSTNEVGAVNGSGSTASVFSNCTIHIPDYSSSNYKTISFDGTIENAGTRGDGALYSSLWSNVSAITSVKILPSTGTFVEGSTISLYGISKVTSTPKATGGIISEDSTYWYHTFPFTSTFTPTSALTADVLCIAGGGGGGSSADVPSGPYAGGGGGAGGYRLLTSQSFTTTNYAVTIGAGGAGGSANKGANGVNSSLIGGALSISSTAGGGGAGGNGAGVGYISASSGGSGGGGAAYSATTGAAGNSGSYSPVEGYAGGNGAAGTYDSGGGGGGAGGAGTAGNSSSSVDVAGGIGSSTASSWGIATRTGQQVGSTVYYAGGGGGGRLGPTINTQGPGGTGGSGGGGQGGWGTSIAGKNALMNTGSGGGAGARGPAGGNGGSGLVIVRYAK